MERSVRRTESPEMTGHVAARAPNLRWGGRTPRGSDPGSWCVSKNRQQMLIYVCLQTEAIIESVGTTHLLLVNTHPIMRWLTASYVTHTFSGNWEWKGSATTELEVLRAAESCRTELQALSPFLLCVCLLRSSWVTCLSVLSLSVWLYESCQLRLLHKLDLVKFHSALRLLLL